MKLLLKLSSLYYWLQFKIRGCTCDIEPYLGDILREDPNCNYHNWLYRKWNI